MRIFFDPDTVYGMRRAVVDGFAVMANQKTNVYRNSPLWRKGVVEGVAMLPRKDHRKPASRMDTGSGHITEDQNGDVQQQSKLGLGQLFTPPQTSKQLSGGSSMFQKVFMKLHVPAMIKIPEGTAVVCIDLFGYDGFAAEACFNMSLSSSIIGCGTVCHSYDLHKQTMNSISRHVHGSARAGTLEIPGFPKFDTIVNALNAQCMAPTVVLAVTTLLPCGALVINDALVAKWSNNEWTKEARPRVPGNDCACASSCSVSGPGSPGSHKRIHINDKRYMKYMLFTRIV